MLRWMFWEQYNHEPNIATLRFWMRWLGADQLDRRFSGCKCRASEQAGNAALKLMDEHLAGRDWFVGDAISLADICLFAYTHVADDADFDLERYPQCVAWIERIKAEPRYMRDERLTQPCPPSGGRLHRPPSWPLREGAALFVS